MTMCEGTSSPHPPDVCTDNWEEHHQQGLRLRASHRNLTSPACSAAAGKADWGVQQPALGKHISRVTTGASIKKPLVRVGSFPASPGYSCPKTAPHDGCGHRTGGCRGQHCHALGPHYPSQCSTGNKNETLTLLTSWLHGS